MVKVLSENRVQQLVVEMVFKTSTVDRVPGLQGVLPEQSSTDCVRVGRSASSGRFRLTDAAFCCQAQDFWLEFWPGRACKFFCQGGSQQGQACTIASEQDV